MKKQKREHWKIGLVTFLFTVFIVSGCSNIHRRDNSSRRVVDRFGQLKVNGTKIISEKGDTVKLEGMSMFWSQWIHKYYNYKCVKWLRDDWHCEIIRVPLGVKPNGYLEHPKREMRKMTRVIDDCIDLGIYVIVDWHSHTAEAEIEESIHFFTEIAKRYGNKPNILYEIYNEPLIVSWNEVVKPYHEEVIAAIRKYDPDNIILAGTTQWAQNVDEAADNPLDDKNTVYTLHFYAETHKQLLRDKATYAIDKGLPIWITEWGTCNSDGNGPIDYEELKLWYDFMEEYQLSWCNWSVSDKKETSAVLLPNAGTKGKWPDSILSESGKIVRKRLRQMNP